MNANVVVNTTWSQVERNSFNEKQIYSDDGSIDYSKTYSSGNGPGQINSAFYDAAALSASGGTKIYNLSSMSGTLFGSAILENFTGVKSLTIKNSSTSTNATLDLIINTGSGFDSIFGNPTGIISISPSGSVHKNSQRGVAVTASDRFIVVQNNSDVPCYYEIMVMGNK